MQVIPGYPLSAIGNACGTCGSAGIVPNEQTVDISFAVEDTTPNGDVIVCLNCAREIGRLAGCINPEAVAGLTAAYQEAQLAVVQLEAQRDALRNVVEALAVALCTDPDLALQIAMQARGKTWELPVVEDPAVTIGEAVAAEPSVQVGAVIPR